MIIEKATLFLEFLLRTRHYGLDVATRTVTAMIPASQIALPVLEQALSASLWPHLEEIHARTFQRVLDAFIRHKVGEEHFYSVSGYGHDDLGREVTDAVFADALQAEAAMVRPQIVSGTHAISVALNGCLRPGHRLLSLTGAPYDTLEEVIGKRGDSSQSLIARGVTYQEISVFAPTDNPTSRPAGERPYFNADEAREIELADTVFIQRSRGYSLRPSLTLPEIGNLIRAVRQIKPDVLVMVDNCYGEFTDIQEPTAVGADLMAGSLIKNPGGGIVPTGGYVAGRKDLVAAAADALTCPGIGPDGGYTFNLTRLILQGLFLAPGVVKEALKGMTLAARVFEELGYVTSPHWQEVRSDIIQVITLEDPDKLIRFCQAVQSVSPVGSAITPVPARPPGYADEVVMAGGTFIDGSTLELSADGPLRPPYAVFLQGGLTYAHTRYALEKILSAL